VKFSGKEGGLYKPERKVVLNRPVDKKKKTTVKTSEEILEELYAPNMDNKMSSNVSRIE
jgi:hypothetical protein